MAGRFEAFERELRLANAGFNEETRQALIQLARDSEAEAIRDSGMQPSVTRYVNGREGAAIESVELPGPIVIEFDYIAEAVDYCHKYFYGRAPVDTGEYKGSMTTFVNGSEDPFMKTYKTGDEVVLVPLIDYSRMLEVGKKRDGRPFVVQVPPGIIEDTYDATRRRYGNIVNIAFTWQAFEGVDLPNNNRMPCILFSSADVKFGADVRAPVATRASGKFGRKSIRRPR